MFSFCCMNYVYISRISLIHRVNCFILIIWQPSEKKYCFWVIKHKYGLSLKWSLHYVLNTMDLKFEHGVIQHTLPPLTALNSFDSNRVSEVVTKLFLQNALSFITSQSSSAVIWVSSRGCLLKLNLRRPTQFFLCGDQSRRFGCWLILSSCMTCQCKLLALNCEWEFWKRLPYILITACW